MQSDELLTHLWTPDASLGVKVRDRVGLQVLIFVGPVVDEEGQTLREAEPGVCQVSQSAIGVEAYGRPFSGLAFEAIEVCVDAGRHEEATISARLATRLLALLVPWPDL